MAIKRQYVINIFKSVFESYGFEPLETPALEYEEILLGKYGEEEDKLMYRFTDLGGRRVALRYDQTVPLARVVAQYGLTGSPPVITMPFKRYQIQPVWRAENTQKGRFREFLQCDADIVGVNTLLSDAEILALVYQACKKLRLDVLIKINDRDLLKTISMQALPILDKLNKIGEERVLRELEEKRFTTQEAKNLLAQARALKISSNLQKVVELYERLGYPVESLIFDGTLVRGLDYYTGLIFEVVLKSNPNSQSLCGGGRYDKLIGMFAGRDIPAVGFAFGFDRIMEAMEELKLFPQNLATTQVLVTVFSQKLLNESIKTAKLLREKNIAAELYLDPDKKLGAQLKYADRKGIPWVAIIGPEEKGKGVITVKNLLSKTQKKEIKLEEFISLLSK